jgi:release factor glutamine methyltransferase
MTEVWTVRRVIAWIQGDLERRGIDSARLDADLLVAHALKVKRIALYLDLDRPLVAAELAEIRKLVERRRAREPIAYILGEREFYGRTFEVTRDVLIPRPDTETLVEQAMTFLRDPAPAGGVLDLCTGSGCVIVSVLAECPERSGVATDISEAALAVARRNAERHGVASRLTLRAGDLFGALVDAEPFACITVNPPYIAPSALEGLMPEVRDFEPRIALEAAAEGYAFYERLAKESPRYLLPGGALMAEVGIDQAPRVADLWREGGLREVRCARDLGGVERVVVGYAARG